MSRKILAILLAAIMMITLLTGCGGGNSTPGGESTQSGEEPGTEASQATEESSEVNTAEPAPITYTYHEKWPTGGINTWSPTDWETTAEGNIQDYTSTYLYTFEMNDTKDGYEIWPMGASELPIDVTAEYAGNESYGVPADATEGYAWKISLNPAACWENGDPINADSYIYTIQQYLNPEMKNNRAPMFYEGLSGLANAKQYYLGGGFNHIDAVDTVGDAAAFAGLAEDVYINTAEPCIRLGKSMEQAVSDGFGDSFILSDGTNFLDKYENGADIKVDEALYNDLVDLCAISGVDPANWIQFCFTLVPVEEIPWEQVGVVKNDAYSFTVILANPISAFNAVYALSIAPIYEPLYEANKETVGNLVKSTYGTSADKWISSGPYKLTEYQADKHIVFEKNENWFGYSDPRFEGMYQTTGIDISFEDDPATRLSLFLQGRSDYVELQVEDMELYGSSKYTYYTPEPTTWVLRFNTDPETLEAEDTNTVCHSILQLEDFRHAISLSLDRADISQALAAAPGYGLLNDSYISDPGTGALYRDSEYAKQALNELYGVDEDGEIAGYDKNAAAALFQFSYHNAIAQGLMNATKVIELNLYCPDASKLYQDWVSIIQAAIDNATIGTSLENTITVNLVVVNDVDTSCKSGLADMAITPVSGAVMDPYSMMQIFTDPAVNLVYGYDATAHMLTINVSGEDISMSVSGWYEALCHGEYAAADVDIRNQILAAMEKGILEQYGQVVLCYDMAAGMYSQRIVLGSEEYINALVGRGGIARMTYTMTDAEWDEYCASQNNSLDY